MEVFLTAPDGQDLVVVRVWTDQPGLYGLGCATLAYRAAAVREVVLTYLKPLLIGRDASRIEELWTLMHHNPYWRGGPIENNAIAGIDMALWDIKAKQAGMPLYDLLGGKCRDRLTVYRHCNFATADEIIDKAKQYVREGCRHIRAAYTSFDGPGGDGSYLCLAQSGKMYDPKRHMRVIIQLMQRLRDELGPDIELMTDTHERLDPCDAIVLARELEPVHLFFMEDPLSPEQLDWLPRLREGCKTPIAIGEVFSHPSEYQRVIMNRWADYIRCHISDIGGLTPARKIAHLAETFGVKTAWHGPLDMTPIAMAAQAHLGYASPNFGIQEYCGWGEAASVIFPGMPTVENGALTLRGAPGLGVDFNEKEAAKYPPRLGVTRWTEMRLPDGTLHTP